MRAHAAEHSLSNHLYLWPTRLAYAVHGYGSKEHSHYAATLVMGLDDRFGLRVNGGVLYSERVAAIAPNTVFSLEAPSTRLLIVNIDPDAPGYVPLNDALVRESYLHISLARFQSMYDSLEALFAGDVSCSDALGLTDELLSRAARPSPANEHDRVARDARVLHVIDRIRHSVEIIDIERLATEANVSSDRLIRLFKHHTGTTIRTYALWARLRTAMSRLQTGGNLTHIAQDAGFYDLPHLARTAARMYGVRSAPFNNAKSVQLHRCKSWECIRS